MDLSEEAWPLETTLCLIRHGETDWNREGRAQGLEDIPLNETGRDQARRLAARLAGEPWTALYSSPLSRALETARIVGAATGLAPQVEPLLVERNMGAIAGLTFAEREARFPGLPLDAIPGVEPLADLTRRALAAVDRIARQHPGGRVLVVGHGGLFGALVLHLSGEAVRLPNTSLTWLAGVPGRWRLGTVGDARHLEGNEG